MFSYSSIELYLYKTDFRYTSQDVLRTVSCKLFFPEWEGLWWTRFGYRISIHTRRTYTLRNIQDFLTAYLYHNINPSIEKKGTMLIQSLRRFQHYSSYITVTVHLFMGKQTSNRLGNMPCQNALNYDRALRLSICVVFDKTGVYVPFILNCNVLGRKLLKWTRYTIIL